ncbi:hypothetical protein N801_04055 [Knoellia aerolata DSM 18566]|uniref:Uncharacterized protein n=1 Tax=Knoellia aerolata DSM 18566 TaxID=1385519 RepID=A0A0A0JXF5_9MICO|nr:hypothetical protein N801_04055 [Knoellia aerolata DSM 18566]
MPTLEPVSDVPDAPLKAGPASDVKTGDDVDVVPSAPASDVEYVHDPALDRP